MWFPALRCAAKWFNQLWTPDGSSDVKLLHWMWHENTTLIPTHWRAQIKFNTPRERDRDVLSNFELPNVFQGRKFSTPPIYRVPFFVLENIKPYLFSFIFLLLHVSLENDKIEMTWNTPALCLGWRALYHIEPFTEKHFFYWHKIHFRTFLFSSISKNGKFVRAPPLRRWTNESRIECVLCETNTFAKVAKVTNTSVTTAEEGERENQWGRVRLC